MKQILHCISITCFLVFGLAFTSQAQVSQEFVNAIGGQALEITINSTPQRPVVRELPRSGSAFFQSSNSRVGARGTDVLEYVPANGFFGKDTMLVQSWTDTPNLRAVRTEYIITVGPSVVTANDDYASGLMNQTINIDVLTNDQATFGGLSVTAITVSTNGNASILGNGTVDFVPFTGFRGIATFSYSVCDLLGVCDDAVVAVTVLDPNPSSDTLSIQVPKNGAQVVLMDNQGFPLTIAPSNGTLGSSSPLLYSPNTDYVGQDQFEWSSSQSGVTYTKVVYVDVLDINPANQFAVDDEAFISTNTVAYLNVLSNDIQGSNLSGFAIVGAPANGTASIQNGLVVYTPNANYAGVDQLIYRVFPPGYSGPAEYATVDILVDDLQPALVDFYLETPKNTPLVMDYPIPFSNYAFGISNPVPANGDAAFYPSIDSNIAGFDVLGDRLLIYNPTTGFTGNDMVVANYCITSTGACIALNIHIDVLDVDPPAGGWCVQECVWPGDTDNNGIVELADLLPIGQAHGEVGIQRGQSAGASWTGLSATEWNQQNTSGRNLKFADSDGDGIIAAADTMDIMANLGRYHKPYPATAARISSLPVFLSIPFDTIFEGELYYIDILLGTPTFYANNIYGFTYELNYATDFVREGSQRLIYDNNSYAAYGGPTLNLQHEEEFGRLETAFTRTNGISVTGYGRVAQFEFIGEEDVLGFRPTALQAPGTDPNHVEVIGEADFSITNATVSIDGQRVNVPSTKLRVPVARRPAGLALSDRDLIVFPNPAGETTRIHLNGAEQIDLLEVLNDIGQVVLSVRDLDNDYQLSLNAMPKGVYTIRVLSEGTSLNKRLVKQ
jgi:hypothetical protein